ncbi:MAG TPA: hypothetical protein VNX15_05035 [Gemmatimonadales bacterium]|jgi:hypothetical protein|nr:hypothetical protein [Gemmatimonadales bacterium]
MRSEDLWYIGYIAAVTPLLVISAIGWWKASRRVKKLEQQLVQAPLPEDPRIENTIDALAAQMNELANAQEFMQRMLLKKVEQPPKATTPH